MLMRSALDVVGRLSPAAWHDPQEVAARGEELSRLLGRPITGFEIFVCRAREAGYEVRDWTFVRSDGQRLAVSLAVTAMRSADGQLSGFLGVAMDISQRRRADELEVARRSAEVANQAKSAFLSRMSHELRTPLNAVLGYAQLIEASADEPPSGNQRRHLEQIQRSGWHLVRLIDDVLDLARIEAGTLRMAIAAVDVRQAVARAVEIVQPQLDQLGVALTLHGLDGVGTLALPPVQADPTRLTQVLVNLLSNAAKYNRSGGRVRLESVLTDDDGVALRVVDDGLGMTAAQLAQLFEPFNRLGREGGAIEGTGIGLVITRHLVELMHGRLDVASTPDRGSTFAVWLPAHRAAPQPPPQDIAAPRAPLAAAAARVLYIEDNEVNATLMRELLRQRPAIELLVAGSVGEGLAIARSQHLDLLLLDMHLPDGHGHQVIDALAADPGLRQLPIVVVSADATLAQVGNALERGVAAYLTKPIDVAETLTTIDRLLEPR
jgi:signal transduction histidine kinase/CheY-like chemotaxis protein